MNNKRYFKFSPYKLFKLSTHGPTGEALRYRGYGGYGSRLPGNEIGVKDFFRRFRSRLGVLRGGR